MAKQLWSVLLASLLSISLAIESQNSTRSSRQFIYSDKPFYQPTIQYYYVGTVQNGPENGNPGAAKQPRIPERFYNADYNTGVIHHANDNPAKQVGNYDDGFYNTNPYSGENISFRQLNLFGGLFNNRFANGNTNLNTFRPFANRVPLLIQNPDVVTRFSSCEAGSGEKGICVSGVDCNLYGGRGAGSCNLGSVCCVNVIKKCSGTVTLNNTYFQSPDAGKLTTPTTCAITVKLDARLKEQTQSICQVRLDFLSFSIGQPSQTGPGITKSDQAIATQCNKDKFQVGGAVNTVPTICGDNDNQHMYLHITPSSKAPTDLRLAFTLDSSSISRYWNIRIAMLPCSSIYLAPPDCLQYITASSGKVSSFNWKDIAISTRQLANQNYKICFRTELIDNKRAESICFSECSINSGDSFLLSGTSSASLSLAGTGGTNTCNDVGDYIVVASVSETHNDRFCGNFLNPLGGKNSNGQICTKGKPFELLYRTDDRETDPDASSSAREKDNVGFCLSFQMKAA